MIDLMLIDEVNCSIDGLTPKEISYIISKTELPVPGAFTTAAYKMKTWNGKESLFSEDGLFFQHMIPDVLDVLEELGYDLDQDINLIDHRSNYGPFDIPLVGDDYLKKETGYYLREHQKDAINAVIVEQKGMIDFATNAGKTVITLGISKAFDSYMGSLVVVPSENLVKQTYKDYAKSDLNAFAMTKNVKPKDRAKKFKEHRHIIITSKLLLNCLEYVSEKPYVLLYDEAHVMGDVIMNALRLDLSECPVRVGLTGTVPKDKLKRQKVFSHLGGKVLGKVTAKYLIDKQYASSTEIDTFRTSHPEMEELSLDSKEWTWELEEKYLGTHNGRIEAIASFIQSLDIKNTLVLCHPELGKRLSKYFNGRMIIDATSTDTREEWFAEFDNADDVFLCGSFGCAATGISVNRIKRLILIDAGKNETIVKQGIGRGLRLDGEANELEVIDVSAKTKYSDRHYKERMKLYKSEKYEYNEIDDTIKVIGD